MVSSHYLGMMMIVQWHLRNQSALQSQRWRWREKMKKISFCLVDQLQGNDIGEIVKALVNSLDRQVLDVLTQKVSKWQSKQAQTRRRL